MYSAIELLEQGVMPTVRCCGHNWAREVVDCINAKDELIEARKNCCNDYAYRNIAASLLRLAHRLIKEQYQVIVSMAHSDFNPGVPTYQMLDWTRAVEKYFEDKGGIQ